MVLMMLTETWLRDHLDAEVSINSYTLFRADRDRRKKKSGRNSGGVAIYLRDDVSTQTEVLLHYSSGVIEALLLKIPKLNLVVATLYRQPNDSSGGNISTSEQFQDLLVEIDKVLHSLQSPLPTVVLAGDFNLPHTSWPSCSPISGATKDEKKMISMLSKFVSDNFLSQLIDKPTHRGGNTLDLFLTNNADVFPSAEIDPTAFSSHYVVVTQSFISGTEDSRTAASPNLRTGFDALNFYSDDTNWDRINQELSSIDWGERLSNHDLTDAFNGFIQTCLEVSKKYTPSRKNGARAKNKVPRCRKALMRRRRKKRMQMHSAKNASRKESLERDLIEIERKLQESYVEEERITEGKAVEAINKNSKYFYSYAKKHSTTPSTIGPLEGADGETTDDPLAMAEILNEQYASVFSSPMVATIEANDAPNLRTEDLDFSEHNVMEAIDDLSANSAAGPDRFPALLLKKCKSSLAKPLCNLWRRSLDSGFIPALLKSSNITPIHKGGPRQQPKNYRPVALTSHLIKVFEKLMRNHIVQFIETNTLMNPNQHGFRAGRSCLSQLLHHFDQVTKLLEQGKNVDVIYLDFGKAFDKLDFQITLQKLHKIGVVGKLHRWIKAFLTGRKQSVVVQQNISGETSVVSGVPQGSVIGPLLFLIMIKDIDSNTMSSFVSSFADDTRVMAGIDSIHDVQNMQTDLDVIYQWARNNNAVFNADKFECLRYGGNQELISSTHYLSNSATPITSCTSVRDLGVTMCSDATFSEHIAKSCTAASLKCGWILRTFKTRERLPLLTLWRSLVMPILDYCCQLWSPAAAGLIQKIEMVQVSFLKKIVGMGSLDYWEQLDRLNLYSLERRRERYIAIYVWKVMEGKVPNFGVQVSCNGRTGRHCIIPKVRTTISRRIQTIRFNSLAVNGSRIFNSLPIHIRNKSGCSVESFKATLDVYLKSVPDEPRVGKLIKFCRKSSNSLIQY